MLDIFISDFINFVSNDVLIWDGQLRIMLIEQTKILCEQKWLLASQNSRIAFVCGELLHAHFRNAC